MRLRGAALFVANATRADAGRYSVRCSNAEGSGTAALSLTVHCERPLADGRGTAAERRHRESLGWGGESAP